jgi:5-hydroxyisourate hydrolase
MTLSTHILDTAHGLPARGVTIYLSKGNVVLFEGITNEDGRCPELSALQVYQGLYSLTFAVAEYFRGLGAALTDPPFLDTITIDFGIADAAAHYHVPLLVSPFAYSTYRGS